MNKKKKNIEPLYIYDKNRNPQEVYLSIDDYNLFMEKLKKLSEQARSKVKVKVKKKL